MSERRTSAPWRRRRGAFCLEKNPPNPSTETVENLVETSRDATVIPRSSWAWSDLHSVTAARRRHAICVMGFFSPRRRRRALARGLDRERKRFHRVVDLGGVVEAADPEPQRGVDPLIRQSQGS